MAAPACMMACIWVCNVTCSVACSLSSIVTVLWLAEALVLALKRVSSLIVTLSESGRALPRPEGAYLDQLVEGLCRYPDCAQQHSTTLRTYAPLLTL